MPRRFTLPLLALLTAAAFASGCGSDDDKKDTASSGAAAATTEAAPDTATTEATDGAIDEKNLREFIDAVNEDPSIICDADNATAELLEQLGGEDACKAAAAGEEAGPEYTIDDLTIDGDSATVVITDDKETSTNLFVQQGDQLKFAGQK